MMIPRVLLADDHPQFLAIVARLLEPDFEIVKTVNDGQSAIDEALKLQPDVLVLDITMPVLNGIAAARRLKLTDFTGKIIFLTQHADADYVGAARAAGAQGFVDKGQLASDLLRALREVLAGKSFVSRSLTGADGQFD